MTRTRLIALTLAVALAVFAPAALGSTPPHARTFGGTPTVGALFAGPLSSHFCTASVVRSPRGDVLLTAAHCVTGTGVGLQFAPGFHDGVSPYGRFNVTAVYVDPAWVTRQDPRRDFAFLIVAPRTIGGHRVQVEQLTGANALGTRPRPGRRVTIPAYPAGADNDPITCTVRAYYDGVYPAFDCTPYPDGTSGAPWIVQTRHGRTVVGVIGGLHQGGCFPYTSYSAPFGAAVRRAYARAIERATPDVSPAPGPDGC